VHPHANTKTTDPTTPPHPSHPGPTAPPKTQTQTVGGQKGTHFQRNVIVVCSFSTVSELRLVSELKGRVFWKARSAWRQRASTGHQLEYQGQSWGSTLSNESQETLKRGAKMGFHTKGSLRTIVEKNLEGGCRYDRQYLSERDRDQRKGKGAVSTKKKN